MALSYTIQSVTTPPAAGGTTVLTGFGFQPTLGIVFGTRTSGTQGLAAAFRIGLDDGSHRYSKAINGGNFVGQHFADGWMSNAHSILAMRTQGLNELMVEAHITFQSDGATIHWDFVLVATGVKFYIVFLGGIDASVFGWQPSSSPYSSTQPNFRPTGLFGIQLGDVFGNVLQADGGTASFGAGNFSCGQVSMSSSYKTNFGVPTTNCRAYQKNGEFVTEINSSTGAIARKNIITSIDALGFTVTNTGGGTYGVAAVKGCAVNAGVFNQPLTPSDLAVSIPAGTGRLAIIFSFGKPSSSVSVSDLNISFGAGYVGRQRSVWAGSLNGAIGETADSKEDETYIGVVYTPTGDFASTINTRVSLTSFTPQLMNLNFPLVDGTAREWGYIVFAEEVPGNTCGETAPDAPGEGIYQITLNKRHDTIYNPYPSTSNFKIP